MLLVGAGLLIRSLQRLEGVNPGFNTEQTVSMEISLPVARYEEGDQMPFYQRLEERVQAHRRGPRRRRREHPAAQQQLRQPRHPD